MATTEEIVETVEVAATTPATAQDVLNEGSSFVQGAVEYLATFVQENWLNVAFALAIYIIGKWIAGTVTRLVKKGMGKKDVDPALISFLGSLIYCGLMAMVFISVIQKIGIPTTSFVAIFAAAGLAVGLALQGSLSNFASGTLIILFKPFKIGDLIEAGGTLGVVEDIGVLVTIMKTPDNKKIIAPNSEIMGGVITNIAANSERRIDMTWGVSYDDDLDKAKEVLMDELVKHPNVLKAPAPVVEIWEYADSSINFIVRPWVETSNWFSTRCELMSTIKKRLDAEGMSIPYPQRDVHMIKDAD
jgi:small conductance mechanosensitive channel|tara:strand:- start:10 stop:915 length:906 start_codon:yes stop_codon:yes gene_type:complete